MRSHYLSMHASSLRNPLTLNRVGTKVAESSPFLPLAYCKSGQSSDVALVPPLLA